VIPAKLLFPRTAAVWVIIGKAILQEIGCWEGQVGSGVSEGQSDLLGHSGRQS